MGSTSQRRGPGSSEASAGALERAAALLNAFDDTHCELSLGQLVRRSGLPRSTVHRIGGQLIKIGWLDKPFKDYRIGSRLLMLASQAPTRHGLLQAARPSMEDLCAATATTVQLGVLEGTQVTILDTIGDLFASLASNMCTPSQARHSGLGLAMLAWGDDRDVSAALTAGSGGQASRTIANSEAFLNELSAIRDRGWAHKHGAVSCIAAPVFDFTGRVVAALSATWPTGTVQSDCVGPAVIIAAASASRAYSARHWKPPVLTDCGTG